MPIPSSPINGALYVSNLNLPIRTDKSVLHHHSINYQFRHQYQTSSVLLYFLSFEQGFAGSSSPAVVRSSHLAPQLHLDTSNCTFSTRAQAN